jgi:diacylglycerol kinase (ATP)
MNVRVIANPIAGGGKGKIMAEALTRALEGKGKSVELVLTKQAGDNRTAASRSGADCVVAVGGDGSINEVVNGLAGTEAMLAILPAGTANVVARELSIPGDPMRVAEMIANPRPRWMDAGLFGGQRFLLGAGAGLDAAISERVSGQRGKRSSKLRWVWPTVSTILGYSFPKIRVTVDGLLISDQAEYAIVGNCRYSAGVFPATPNAKIDDGLLDVCVFRDLRPWRILHTLPAVWSGGHIRRKDVTYIQGKKVAFHSADDSEVPFQVDGDPRGHLPAEFSIEPRAVQVLAP